MRFSLWHAALTAGAAFGVACDDAGGVGTVFPEADATVYMRDNYFDPSNVTIPRAGKVLFVYAGGRAHNAIFRDPSATENCDTYSAGLCLRELVNPGSFVYDCVLHSGMTGIINVNP